jgi:hypothetical protein
MLLVKFSDELLPIWSFCIAVLLCTDATKSFKGESLTKQATRLKKRWRLRQQTKMTTGVNFTNILWAAFAPKSFSLKITNPNFKHIKAAQRALVWLSISKIFYEQLFHTKVLYAAFMCLQFGVLIFWRKDFGTKAGHKMLVKLTPGLQKVPTPS